MLQAARFVAINVGIPSLVTDNYSPLIRNYIHCARISCPSTLIAY
jgi:hypothetical protein